MLAGLQGLADEVGRCITSFSSNRLLEIGSVPRVWPKYMDSRYKQSIDPVAVFVLATPISGPALMDMV